MFPVNVSTTPKWKSHQSKDLASLVRYCICSIQNKNVTLGNDKDLFIQLASLLFIKYMNTFDYYHVLHLIYEYKWYYNNFKEETFMNS